MPWDGLGGDHLGSLTCGSGFISEMPALILKSVFPKISYKQITCLAQHNVINPLLILGLFFSLFHLLIFHFNIAFVLFPLFPFLLFPLLSNVFVISFFFFLHSVSKYVFLMPLSPSWPVYYYNFLSQPALSLMHILQK